MVELEPNPGLLNPNPKFVPPYACYPIIYTYVFYLVKLCRKRKWSLENPNIEVSWTECVFPFSSVSLTLLLLAIHLALQNINIAQENSGKLKVSNEDSSIPLNTFTVTPFDWKIQRGFSVTSIALPRTAPSLVSVTNTWS